MINARIVTGRGDARNVTELGSSDIRDLVARMITR